MLTQAQKDEYDRVGAIVVPDVLSPAEVAELRAVTDGFVERARAVTAHDAIYDLEDSHSAAQPRVRRIKAPHLHHAAYAALVRHPKIVAVLQDLWGPDIRFDTAKLNLKSAGFGAAVEWHQDWAFYPHTNDDLLAVGVLLDDATEQNGPMMVLPGSHRGPTFDHHGADGRFCGAMEPARDGLDFRQARPLIAPAGSCSFHHVRAVHGSAQNTSAHSRNLLLYEFAAADAFPLLGITDWDEFNSRLLVGEPTVAPRTVDCPIRMPMPPAANQGSIYENQTALQRRYFEPAPVAVPRQST